jgi:hypothetical protein
LVNRSVAAAAADVHLIYHATRNLLADATTTTTI